MFQPEWSTSRELRLEISSNLRILGHCHVCPLTHLIAIVEKIRAQKSDFAFWLSNRLLSKRFHRIRQGLEELLEEETLPDGMI
jgi:hypothetical protein